ncbi:MAG TPA: hypothetical protein V6C58_26520 [Allocoleopsis sp.]
MNEVDKAFQQMIKDHKRMEHIRAVVRKSALESYYKRMAREKGITVEEYKANPPVKRGRPKKIIQENI